MPESTPAPPPIGEKTAEQLSPFGTIRMLGGRAIIGDPALLYASGGNMANPCAFPGYGGLYSGTYATYRWMLQHPIIRLVRAISVSPIIASTWGYEPTEDDVPEAWVKLVTEAFNPLRRRLEEDAMRGRDMGWAPFEPVWEIRDDQVWLARMKPLAVDHTTILTDDHGNFAGLNNGSAKYSADGETFDGKLKAPFKAWIYSYDREVGNLYGRSWLENLRETAWKDWLDCAQQLQKLGAKISGISTVITSPAGTFKDGNGEIITYEQNARDVITALAKGAAGVWFPSLALAVDPKGNADLMKLLMELSKTSLTNIEVLDFGSQSPAILGISQRMQHDEELMFAGGLRPSRSGLEGQHGTKAEAGVHTDTGIINAELDDDDIADQLQVMVDAVLTLNFGEAARGKVRIKPAPLIDAKTETFRAVLDKLLGNPDVGSALAEIIDDEKMMDGLDIPVREGMTLAKVLEEHRERADERAEKKDKAMAGANGNGRMSGAAA